MSRGLLISLEGIDGAGTTTQARMLASWLESQHGIPLLQTCEPSGRPLGVMIRKILCRELSGVPDASLALLYAADRLDHLQHEIQPALAAGDHVVTDRYVYSSLVYQSLSQQPQWVASLNSQAPEPDLTVYLRVDADTAYQRRQQRGGEEELFDADQTQRRLVEGYDALFGQQEAAGTWRRDAAERWTRRTDAPPRSPALDRIGRTPCWAVLDGAPAAEDIHRTLRTLVYKFISSAIR